MTAGEGGVKESMTVFNEGGVKIMSDATYIFFIIPTKTDV